MMGEFKFKLGQRDESKLELKSRIAERAPSLTPVTDVTDAG